MPPWKLSKYSVYTLPWATASKRYQGCIALCDWEIGFASDTLDVKQRSRVLRKCPPGKKTWVAVLSGIGKSPPLVPSWILSNRDPRNHPEAPVWKQIRVAVLSGIGKSCSRVPVWYRAKVAFLLIRRCPQCSPLQIAPPTNCFPYKLPPLAATSVNTLWGAAFRNSCWGDVVDK